jgi:hypothetical protein
MEKSTPQSPPDEPESVQVTPVEQPSDTMEDVRASPIDDTAETALPPLPLVAKEEDKNTTLSIAQLHTLFTGAPHFHITTGLRPTPTASYPWANRVRRFFQEDSIIPTEPALAAAASRTIPSKRQTAVEDDLQKDYNGYEPDTVELPNMQSAQGIEPGTTGFSYFLELPMSDSLVTDSEHSQSNRDTLEATRNKELMQANPERLGIRSVEADLIYDRLIELQDIYETFQDTPEPMTILNNQSSGDLYANLFTKFLMPPGYDDSSDDPTGLQIQINALIRILRLKGVWYDFSLVEWRIRLGQILWSDPEPIPEHESHPLWTEREILLLQITLACELLLRLDAFTNVDASDAEIRLRLDPKDIHSFMKSKNRKVDWDLILARRFLENISVIKGGDAQGLSSQPESRGLLSLLGRSGQADTPRSDLILLPQHQTRQLSGLLHFAKTIEWPSFGAVMKDLAYKLGATDRPEETVQQLSPSEQLFEPTTPSAISVYGTPLQTPLPANHVTDSYFGQIGKPALTRNDSRALRIPLSPTWSSSENRSGPTLDHIGGWLSRSYLTGLVLPGEAISHFLISTLLENDRSAIHSLGDSANLYGGFTYSDRTFWSKNSIVGRVLACVEGSVECMGWISCPKIPEGLTGWHSIHSEQLPYEPRILKASDHDPVAKDSAIVPEEVLASVKSDDFVLPLDIDSQPNGAPTLLHWELTPINPDLIDDEDMAGPPTESDIHVPSVTFASQEQRSNHTFTLAYDVQFITSWPCSPQAAKIVRPTSVRPDLKRSLTGTLSCSSSKRSETLSRRNSHGFEPLLSHPPDATDITPKRTYDADPDDSLVPVQQNKSVNAHILHGSYLYKIVPVTEVLDPDFQLSFDMHTSRSSERLLSSSHYTDSDESTISKSKKTVLVLDARGASDLELLARAWCAEKGLHAIIGRTGRTCLACCIREARGLGINIVIRV